MKCPAPAGAPRGTIPTPWNDRVCTRGGLLAHAHERMGVAEDSEAKVRQTSHRRTSARQGRGRRDNHRREEVISGSRISDSTGNVVARGESSRCINTPPAFAGVRHSRKTDCNRRMQRGSEDDQERELDRGRDHEPNRDQDLQPPRQSPLAVHQVLSCQLGRLGDHGSSW